MLKFAHQFITSNPFVLSLAKHEALSSLRHAIKAVVNVGAAPRREKEL
jgi:hypothetical protein